MRKRAMGLVVGVMLLGLCDESALAAQQAAPTKRLTVRTSRRIILRSGSAAPIVGNPVLNGATFHLQLTPGGTQCFQLPASNWEAFGIAPGSNGYRYSDGSLVNGSVNAARIRQSASGQLSIKIKARSPGITIAPGNPTLTYAANLAIKGGGDEYCSSTGTATPIANTDRVFIVKRDNGGACTVAACSPSGAFLERSESLF